MNTTITEQDRATARRVIRRQAEGSDKARIFVLPAQFADRAPYVSVANWSGSSVAVGETVFTAACEAAALGRAYGKALRSAP